MTLPHKPAASAERPPTAAPAMRGFGRFLLRQLLGKSERSMTWLAHDPRVGQDLMLTLPRVQPQDAAALEAWQRDVGAAARLNHPHLAAVGEIAVQDHWPYVAVDRAYGVTLGEWMDGHGGSSVAEQVGWICQALEGLAFAHDAGAAHGDLQFHSLLVSEQGAVRLMGLATAGAPAPAHGRPPSEPQGRVMAVAASDLRAHRERAERDVVAIGLLLYRLLSGQSPLDEPDVSVVL
ncbi:MAG: protein kinase, partial [Ideonella sp.]|nr:protein kinase [Ideonella sp.]